MKLQYLTMAS